MNESKPFSLEWWLSVLEEYSIIQKECYMCEPPEVYREAIEKIDWVRNRIQKKYGNYLTKDEITTIIELLSIEVHLWERDDFLPLIEKLESKL